MATWFIGLATPEWQLTVHSKSFERLFFWARQSRASICHFFRANAPILGPTRFHILLAREWNWDIPPASTFIKIGQGTMRLLTYFYLCDPRVTRSKIRSNKRHEGVQKVPKSNLWALSHAGLNACTRSGFWFRSRIYCFDSFILSYFDENCSHSLCETKNVQTSSIIDLNKVKSDESSYPIFSRPISH